MSRAVKLGLYIVCIIGVVLFSSLALSAYREAAQSAEQNKERLNQLASPDAPAPNPSGDTNAASAGGTNGTNAAAATTPGTDTNAAPATNESSAVAPAPTNETTGALTADTNTPATNAAAAATGKTVKAKGKKNAETPAAASAKGYTKMVTYGLAAVLSLIGLAILIGYDVSHFVGHRAESILFNDEGQPANPEYEKAEQLWADGKYLDAVRAMRDYLNKNPREQYVALRIAEIYEENLNNPLAAALEYEEVLKKKLPPERWGWAAIHLANIYSGKLSKPEQSIALLRRIDAEYGQTAAAKKARERLMQVDPAFVPAMTAAAVPETEEPGATARPESNLPPGFRPKDS